MQPLSLNTESTGPLRRLVERVTFHSAHHCPGNVGPCRQSGWCPVTTTRVQPVTGNSPLYQKRRLRRVGFTRSRCPNPTAAGCDYPPNNFSGTFAMSLCAKISP
jgi:hypothetical protein